MAAAETWVENSILQVEIFASSVMLFLNQAFMLFIISLNIFFFFFLQTFLLLIEYPARKIILENSKADFTTVWQLVKTRQYCTPPQKKKQTLHTTVFNFKDTSLGKTIVMTPFASM